jgi:hypothetical protein
MPTNSSDIVESEATETRRCQRCGLIVNIAEACAIGKTCVILYYCPPCYEVVVNEDQHHA